MTQDQLYAAIDAAPRDWSLRLMLADWCETNGEPAEAEFHRWMCGHRRVADICSSGLFCFTERRWASWSREHILPPIRPDRRSFDTQFHTHEYCRREVEKLLRQELWMFRWPWWVSRRLDVRREPVFFDEPVYETLEVK